MVQGIIQESSIKSLWQQAQAGSEHRLHEFMFMPKELSMFAWGMGQLVDARKDLQQRQQTRPAEGSIENSESFCKVF